MAQPQITIQQLQSSRNLTHELVESLRKQIIDGNLQPGDKLPAAREIELQAGVSRSVVREALAALKAEGLIISRQGIGAFVAESARKRPFAIEEDEFHSIEDAVQILELRMAVEIEMSAMAASNRTKKQMADIWKCLDDFDRKVEAGDDAVMEDYSFHLAIAKATGNLYFSRFIKYIGLGLIPSREIITKNDSSRSSANYLAMIQEEHRNIAQAIEDQDVTAAREATRKHLGKSRERHIRITRKLRRRAQA